MLERVFHDEASLAELLSVDAMRQETQLLHSDELGEWAHNWPIVGGDQVLDVRNAVAIGILQFDAPFVLDYQTGPDAPRVLNYTDTGWVEVAGSVEELLQRLAL